MADYKNFKKIAGRYLGLVLAVIIIAAVAVLDGSDYPEAFKEMCKVYEAEVAEEVNDGEVVVKYISEQGGEKRRKVKKDYLPDLKVGDKVWIHWMYAVEEIEE